jgi:hypothetical protein
LFNYSTSTPVAVPPAVVSSSKGRNRIGATTGGRVTTTGGGRGDRVTTTGGGRGRVTTTGGGRGGRVTTTGGGRGDRVTATSLTGTGPTGRANPPPVPVIASPPQGGVHPAPAVRLGGKEEGDPASNYGKHIANRDGTKDDDDRDEEDSDADGDTGTDADEITSPRVSKIAPPSILADPNSDPINQDDNTPVLQDDTINNTKPLNSDIHSDKGNTTDIQVKNTTHSEFNDQGSVSVPKQDGNDNTKIPVHVAANSTNNNTTLPDLDTNRTQIHHHSNENLTKTKTKTTVNATSGRATHEGSMTGSSNNTSNNTREVLSNNNVTIQISNETSGGALAAATTNNVTNGTNGTIPINGTPTRLPPTVLSPNVTNTTSTILRPLNTTWSDATTNNVTNGTKEKIPINATMLLSPSELSTNAATMKTTRTNRRNRRNQNIKDDAMHNNNNNTLTADPTEEPFSNTTEMTNSSTHTTNSSATRTTVQQVVDKNNVTATTNLRGERYKGKQVVAVG